MVGQWKILFSIDHKWIKTQSYIEINNKMFIFWVYCEFYL